MTVTNPKTLPQANGDFYAIDSTLSEEDQTLLRQVRAFLEAEVAPVITEYWIREEFPYQLLPKLAELHIMGLPYQGYGCPGNGILLDQQVGRFVADAEAIYSYEGTREMNTLIVGKAITGFSAFV
jgi:alkylation response protein AidB-like acyl-CoA dehydrogenase